jgi:beta-lactamase class A
VIVAVALLLGAPLFIFFGSLSDRVGRLKIMMAGNLIAAISYLPIYHAMKAYSDPINPVMLTILVFIQVIFVTMVYGPIAAFLVEAFPAKIRYTSLSLPYHFGNGWFGGFPSAHLDVDRRQDRKHLRRTLLSNRCGGNHVLRSEHSSSRNGTRTRSGMRSKTWAREPHDPGKAHLSFDGCRLTAVGRVEAQIAPASLGSLRDVITTRIARDSGAIVGVAYVDLQTGDKLSIAADSSFHAASTMKVPVMIEVLRRAQQGAFSLDQGILLINQFRSIADGSPFSLDPKEDGDTTLYGKIGERVTVREMLQLMIVRSSNLATNQLIELVGAKNVTAGAVGLGAAHTRVLRGVEDQKAFDAGMINSITAGDLATLLDAIENGKVLSAESSALMRDILLAQEFNEKIPAGLPPGTRVAHKTGEITAVSHDAAIVYPAGRKPYVLVVLTRGLRDGKQSSALIADISRFVYAYATSH